MKRSTWNWKDAELPKDKVAKLQADFEAGVFEAALQSNPTSVEVLVTLAELYAKHGPREKGLEIDKRLVQLRPQEAKYFYNLACTHSLLGHIDPALAALRAAVQLGYDKLDHLREDPDLANLKQDKRYDELVRHLQQNEPKTKKLEG